MSSSSESTNRKKLKKRKSRSSSSKKRSSGKQKAALLLSALTKVIENKMAKVSAWYDNEWGFAFRMCDLASYFGKI